LTKLLSCYYDEYFEPEFWEIGKKSRNYLALIRKGSKAIFDRKFINSSTLDNKIVFRQDNFPEGEIIEQKSVYVKGSNEETTFHGFFIIHNMKDGIYGDQITQKDALEYFDCKQRLPELQGSVKNNLRVKLGTVIRKLSQKHGEEIIAEILLDIMAEYFPTPEIPAP